MAFIVTEKIKPGYEDPDNPGQLGKVADLDDITDGPQVKQDVKDNATQIGRNTNNITTRGEEITALARRTKALEDSSGNVLSIGELAVNPERIEKVEDLDGTYQIILSLTDAEVSILSTAGVNYLEVWFGAESIHTVSSWSPTIVTRIDAVIDVTEETQIAASGSIIAVRIVYRINQSGSQTFYAECSGALRIGGYSDQRVLLDRRSSKDTQEVLILENGALYTTVRRTARAATKKQFTTVPYTHDDYLGVDSAGFPDVELHDVGKFFYHIGNHHFYVVRDQDSQTQGEQKAWVQTPISGVDNTVTEAGTGYYTSEISATDHVFGVNEVFYSIHDAAVLRVNSFTAAVSAIYTYDRLKQATVEDIHNLEQVKVDKSDLPPFVDVQVVPAGLPGNDVPENIDILLSDRLETETINAISLVLSGFYTVQPHSSTPIRDIDTEDSGIVRFQLDQTQRDTLSNNNAGNLSMDLTLVIGFAGDREDYRHNIEYPVNNPAFGIPDGSIGTDKLDLDSTSKQKAMRLALGIIDPTPTALSALTFAASLEIDWDDGALRSVTLTGNTTISFTNVSSGDVLVLEVTQDSTGGRGITWPSSVEWPGGSVEGPSTAGGEVDVYTLLALSSTRIVASALLDVS